MRDKPREDVYDAQISPLMAQIIAICKANDIPMAATFELDGLGDTGDESGPLYCTTVIPGDAPGRVITDASRIMRNGWVARPPFEAFAITTREKAG